MNFSGNEKNNTINGTIYSPNGAISLTGNGTLNSQIVAASLAVSGNGEIDVLMQHAAAGTVSTVYLVE